MLLSPKDLHAHSAMTTPDIQKEGKVSIHIEHSNDLINLHCDKTHSKRQNPHLPSIFRSKTRFLGTLLFLMFVMSLMALVMSMFALQHAGRRLTFTEGDVQDEEVDNATLYQVYIKPTGT